MRKPEGIFDRDWEWGELDRFATGSQPGITLGIVSGRRRQGKSMLLHALAESTAGFYYEAIDGNEELARLSISHMRRYLVKAQTMFVVRGSSEADFRQWAETRLGTSIFVIEALRDLKHYGLS